MKNKLIILGLLFPILLFSQNNIKPAPRAELPEWVQLMYGEAPDPAAVKLAYDDYYAAHAFVKNQHTQYYKRWMHALQTYGDNSRLTPEERLKKALLDEQYVKNSRKDDAEFGPTSPWTCLGPFDFDKEAAATSYAAGAAHVYTTEQSASNPNVLYAGTANAGLWKSTDKGLNWSLLTRDMLLSTVYALEIDYSNPDIVYFSGNNKLWKSINGGITISQIGDAAFTAVDQDIADVAMFPTNTNTLFVASNRGLYRTTDGGANWVKVAPGDFQEIEFKPGNPNTVYAVRLNGNHTEFLKSTDGGLTFIPKAGGYPGVASVVTRTFPSKKFLTANDDVQMATNSNLGAGTNANFTIEMWVKSAGWTGDPAIFSNKNWASGANKGFVLAGKTNGNQWKFNIANGSSRMDMDGGVINDDVWHHIAIVYRASGQKELYQDGTLLATSSVNVTGDVSTTLQMTLGQDGTGNYAIGFPGDIAEVRVWNTALPSTTLDTWRYDYITAGHPNYTNLLHYWKCDEGSGTLVQDSKGTNDGTVHGSAGWTVTNTAHFIKTDITGVDEQKRTELAVTPANPDIVYALATGEADGGAGLYGMYRSTDAGETWTFRCCGPGPGGVPSPTNFNLMGWDDGGQDDGGQYYYDLSLGVSPFNADSIYVCGVNLWESSNGGASFTCPSKWSHSGKVNYVHADIHDIKMMPNGDMWLSCDGGIFYSNNHGSVWTRRMYGIAGSDFWGFGAGFQDGSVMLGGTYHNGTLLKDGNTYTNGWISTDGGDNTRGYVNPGKPRIAYSDYNKKALSGNRLVAPATFGFAKKPNTAGNMEFHPNCYNIIYSPVDSILWKTTDDGESWTQVYNFGKDVFIEAVKIAWNNPNILYLSTNPGFYAVKKLLKSTDGGANWTEITPSSAVLNGNTSMRFVITLDGLDDNTLWIGLTHPYNWSAADGYKIFKSTNGGATWTNWTTPALNGEYIEDIEHARGSAGGVYIGTSRTVYYRNNAMADWALFNTDLPLQTYCTRLVPYYKGGKIRNGTNRSVYEADFYENTPPVATISVDKFSSDCSRDTFFFVSHSASRAGTTFNWSFPGGNPATSTDEFPKVTYPAAGSYDVSLTVTDAYGTSSTMKTGLVSIGANLCEADTIPGKTLTLSAPGDYASCPALNIATNSITLSAWIRPNGNQVGNAGIIFSSSGGACGLNFRTGNQLGYHWEDNSGTWGWAGGPTVPVNQWNHVALVIKADSAIVYLNGVPYARQAAHNAVTFSSSFQIGIDRGNTARNFKGLMDEVCIFNQSLTQAQVRELMHLTKTPAEFPGLISYYQFNEPSGRAYDKITNRHASLAGAASRSTSTAPVGKGQSARQTVIGAGTYTFGGTGLSLTFPSGGSYPNGELCVSRIDQSPDQLPTAETHSTAYWVVNNFGTNSFTTLTSANFGAYGYIPSGANASAYQLYKRASRAEGNTWGAVLDNGDAVVPGANGSVLFSSGNGISSFSQFVVMNSAPLPVEWLRFEAALEDNSAVRLYWSVNQTADVSHFIVEKSRDGFEFTDLEKVVAKPSAGTYAYETRDMEPYEGVTYYRLRQVDADGSTTRSPIRSVAIRALADTWVVAPNPIGNGQSLKIYTAETGVFQFRLFDVAGKLVLEKNGASGVTELPIQGLASGMYGYEISCDQKRVRGLVVVE